MPNEWYDIDGWQWVDNDAAQWGFSTAPTTSGLFQIWTDDTYVYAATSSGLAIVDIESEQQTSFATNQGGYTTVWADNEKIFVGCSSGIKVMDKKNVGPKEVFSYLYDYARIPDITSEDVKYIHGNENKLICCTARGVDVFWKNSTGYRAYTRLLGAKKCFATPNNYFYYTVSGTSTSGTPPWYICRLNDITSDWNEPDVTYTTGSGFLTNTTCLHDFYVTEHTSISGINNTLFIAADDGVHVYDEGTDQHVMYTTVS